MLYGERQTKATRRWAMVGGGRGSQIGYIHRSAAQRDRHFALVAGAFDLDPERGRAFGTDLGLDPARCYRDWRTLFSEEAARADGIGAVTIATPNNTHYEIARAALEHGLHVVCEKPLCFTVAEAEDLQRLAHDRGRVVGVTYGYAGHQVLQQAREMIASGALGAIRLVNLQFAHGFHNTAVEVETPAARWRVDPRFAGPSYVLGDLGTHPLYIAEMIAPGLKIRRLLCARQSFVASRAPLEDNAVVLMDYDGGAFGQAWISAVNAGSMHGQKVRIVGEKASLEWWDERPNQLSWEVQGEPARILERGMPYLQPAALAEDRIGTGHPEGLFEAWTNLYDRYALAMEAADEGRPAPVPYPDIAAGVEGVRWVAACVRSADAGGIWVDYR